MNQKDIVLVANSPGELSALVKPVAAELAAQKKGRIILVLTPCQYTSGKETEYIKGIKEIKLVVTATEYQQWALLNRKPKIDFSPKGIVLFLGGDLTHAVIIAKKLKYPAFAYLNERIAWKNFYKLFLVSDQVAYDKFAKNVSKNKLRLVGNLMVDSVADLKKWQPEENVITFMPGSRQWEIDYMTPFYQEVISGIKCQMSNVKCQIVSSPFVKAKPIGGTEAIGFEDAYRSELVVTIPGTNTALLAARGIPMVVVFPLNHPEVIPMEGLANIIGRLPVAGRHFKRLAANIVNRHTRFFALPNQKTEQEIVPEIRGLIEPLTVAEKISELMHDCPKREKMSKRLIEAMGRPGAAKKVVELINERL